MRMSNLIKGIMEGNGENRIDPKRTNLAIHHIRRIHRDNDDGWVAIAAKPDKWYQYHYKPHFIVDRIHNLLGTNNVYISMNSFFRPERKKDTIKQLNALYIDLDYYKVPELQGLTKEQILGQLEMDYFKSIVPEPSLVLDSGRGLTIIWLIKPASKYKLPLWENIQKWLYMQLKKMGADHNSLDPARVLRVAGSYNSKSGSMVRILYENNVIYELEDIEELYCLPCLDERNKSIPKIKVKDASRNTTRKNSKTRRSKGRVIIDNVELCYKRLKDLVKLQEIRNFMCTGHRELMCFLYRYWACCAYGDPGRALEETLEFNSRFTNTLTEEEVIKATESAEKKYYEHLKNSKKGYHYSNARLIELLEISLEEQLQLNTIKSDEAVKLKRKMERRNENGLTKRKQAKIDKLNAIKELYQKGHKQCEIADILGVSRSLVSQYLKILSLRN